MIRLKSWQWFILATPLISIIAFFAIATRFQIHLKNQLDFVKESIWLLKHGGSIAIKDDGVITDARGKTILPSELPPNLYKQFESKLPQSQVNTWAEIICQKPSNLSVNDWKNLTLKYTLIHHPSGSPIELIAISPDHQLLVSYSRNNLLKFWDLNKGKLIKSMLANQDIVTQILFTPDGKNLVMSSLDGTIYFYDSQTLKVNKVLEHSGGVDNITFSRDGKILVSLLKQNLRRKLIVWDLTNDEKINTLTTESSIDDLQITPDNKLIVLTGEHHLKIKELATNEVRAFFRFKDNSVESKRGNFTQMLINPEESFIISSGYKENTSLTPVINIWDLKQLPEKNSNKRKIHDIDVLLPPPLTTIPFHFPDFSNNTSLQSLAITNDSQWALSTGSNSAIFGVNLCTQEKIEAGKGSHFADFIKISADQKLIVTSGITPTSHETRRSDLKIWQFEP